jgi:ubiquitin C-terminal hydrolase
MDDETDRLWVEYVLLTKTMCMGNYRMTPNNFFTQICFAKQKHDHRQEDAHEWLHFLLDHFHQVLVENGRKFKDITPVSSDPKSDKKLLIQQSMDELNRTTDYSIIQKMFMTQFHQRTQCIDCKTYSHRFPIEHEIVLSMDSNTNYTNIYHLLNDNCGRKTLKGSEAYHCEKCCKKCNPGEGNAPAEKCTKTEALQKTTYFRLPKIMIIVFGRFKSSWSGGGMQYTKNGKFIDYPINNLDMTKFCSYPDSTSVLYDLYAVCNHQGSTPDSGHYFTTALAGNKWVVLNDEHFHYVNGKERIISNEAYITFWKRKS